MGSIVNLFDGMKNYVANLGTGRDKAAHATYEPDFLDSHSLNNIYRTSWVARDGVNFPAEDATRNWRYWRAEADQISKIEALEKQLGLQAKTQEALKMARLYGGAAIYINTGQRAQEKPLKPGADIKSLVVLSKDDLHPVEIIKDIDSEYCGGAEYYRLTSGANAQQVAIHASRLVIFTGSEALQSISQRANCGVWSDSVVQAAYDALTQRDSTMSNVASLVFEAKIDVFRFAGFADLLGQSGGDDVLLRRAHLQAAMKGINGAVVIDKEDEYDSKSANFSGLPEVISKFQEEVSGAFGVPVSRLFGRSAAGLSATGDGDERVYYDRVKQNQSLNIGPAIHHFDECLITQALGGRPPEVFYEWAPLRQMTESERSEILSKTATAARAIAGANAGEIIPLDALSDGVVNSLIEMGALPGLEQAIEQYGSYGEQNNLGVGGEGDGATMNDAAPMTLYVHRKVKNASEIIKHYADQGIDNRLSPDDLHVTIMYSRQPVDWMRIGESWQSEISVGEGGPRIMDAFGPNGDTLVLGFASDELVWRHESIKEKGASWDWDDYQPHITIATEFDGDISSVDPWEGKIELGPEVFREIS